MNSLSMNFNPRTDGVAIRLEIQGSLACLQVVPDGLLVFLPSYSLLDRLSIRWKVRVYVRG